MSFELKGKLIEKFDTVNISDTFRKREFVIEKTLTFNDKSYTDSIKFQLTQDKCDILNNFNIGDELLIQFNIRGRKWEKDGKVSYFTNLEAWKIEYASDQEGEFPPPHNEEDIPPEIIVDDLPF